MFKFAALFLAALLVSNSSFAQPVTKKGDKVVKQTILCVDQTMQAVEPDGTFFFLDEKARPVPCLQSMEDDEMMSRPAGERITLSNGTVVKKDIRMNRWIWVFVKNK